MVTFLIIVGVVLLISAFIGFLADRSWKLSLLRVVAGIFFLGLGLFQYADHVETACVAAGGSFVGGECLGVNVDVTVQ